VTVTRLQGSLASCSAAGRELDRAGDVARQPRTRGGCSDRSRAVVVRHVRAGITRQHRSPQQHVRAGLEVGEPVQLPRHRRDGREVTLHDGPGVDGPQIGERELDFGDQRQLVRSRDRSIRTCRQLQCRVTLPLVYLRRLGRPGEPSCRVQPQGLEQPEPSGGQPDDHRRLDETRQTRRHLVSRHLRVRADGFDVVEAEGGGEDRQPPEQQPIGGLQQLVGPSDHPLHRPVAVPVAATGPGQHVDASTQTRREVADRQRHRACCGELDGQGQAIDGSHDLGHRGGSTSPPPMAASRSRKSCTAGSSLVASSGRGARSGARG
jgi:hypothetical protein